MLLVLLCAVGPHASVGRVSVVGIGVGGGRDWLRCGGRLGWGGGYGYGIVVVIRDVAVVGLRCGTGAGIWLIRAWGRELGIFWNFNVIIEGAGGQRRRGVAWRREQCWFIVVGGIDRVGHGRALRGNVRGFFVIICWPVRAESGFTRGAIPWGIGGSRP